MRKTPGAARLRSQTPTGTPTTPPAIIGMAARQFRAERTAQRPTIWAATEAKATSGGTAWAGRA